jgi:hypothetical protein
MERILKAKKLPRMELLFQGENKYARVVGCACSPRPRPFVLEACKRVAVSESKRGECMEIK